MLRPAEARARMSVDEMSIRIIGNGSSRAATPGTSSVATFTRSSSRAATASVA